jgi:hypothetical protein
MNEPNSGDSPSMWKWTWPLVILCVFTLAFAAGRFAIPHRSLSWPGTYQALAHLFVGGLVGAYLADRKANQELFWLAVFLSAVELVAFVVLR